MRQFFNFFFNFFPSDPVWKSRLLRSSHAMRSITKFTVSLSEPAAAVHSCCCCLCLCVSLTA
jgi:hypothetical protein